MQSYSTDFTLNDFHVFSPIRKVVRGRRSSSDEEVIGAVQNGLKTQPKNFFSEGIKKNLRNTGTDALKSRGITLKSNITFVFV
jgi:hypothetical protein